MYASYPAVEIVPNSLPELSEALEDLRKKQKPVRARTFYTGWSILDLGD